MKRIALTLAAVLLTTPAAAQLTTMNVGAGGMGSGGGTPAFQGFGNVQTTNVLTYVSVGRCYKDNYTGNVAEIMAPSDASSTLLTCVSGVLTETLQALATTCATSCTVKTLYDQSASNDCSAAPCTFSEATEATRPRLTMGAQNSKHAMTFTAGQRICQNTPQSGTQPFSWMAVAKRTTFSSAYSAIWQTEGSYIAILFSTNSGNFSGYAGAGPPDVAASEGNIHAFLALFDGGSGKAMVDGSLSTSVNYGTVAFTGSTSCIGPSPTGNNLVGVIYEAALMSGDQSANFSSIDTNLRHASHGWNF